LPGKVRPFSSSVKPKSSLPLVISTVKVVVGFSDNSYLTKSVSSPVTEIAIFKAFVSEVIPAISAI